MILPVLENVVTAEFFFFFFFWFVDSGSVIDVDTRSTKIDIIRNIVANDLVYTRSLYYLSELEHNSLL